MAAPTTTPVSSGIPDSSNVVKPVFTQTLGTNLKRKKKKKYLRANFKYTWPVLSDPIQKDVMETLKNSFEEEGLKRSLCKRGGKRVKESRVDEKDSQVESVADEALQEKWSSLIVGINAVTRALEHKNASVVIADKGATPDILTAHLSELSYQHSIPAAQLTNLSHLAELMGLRSLSCLALKPLEQIKCKGLRSMTEKIISKIPCVEHPIEVSRPADNALDDCDTVLSDDEPEVKCSVTHHLPPEDIEFSSLYVMKKDLENFSSQDDFISLTRYATNDSAAPQPKKLSKRYHFMSTSVGVIKENFNRSGKTKDKSNKKL